MIRFDIVQDSDVDMNVMIKVIRVKGLLKRETEKVWTYLSYIFTLSGEYRRNRAQLSLRNKYAFLLSVALYLPGQSAKNFPEVYSSAASMNTA